MNDKPKIRCGVYTRKSHEEGLEQEFNSLDAQRDACEKYIGSQRGEGWVLIPDSYDDGGFTGGNTERPALQKLLRDIEAGLIDVVVVYKIDRLSRSLLDFLNMVRMFDKQNVSFVSVTQQFNTSTPMGRLMINVLMSFAEYEREVTGERIRDKIAASKAKGMWMGGQTPMGYDCKEHKLHINIVESEIVRFAFEQYYRHGSVIRMVEEMDERGWRSKARTTEKGRKYGGNKISTTYIYNMLRNPIYIGQIRHKDKIYPGEHKPIISQELWDKVHAMLPKDSPEKAALPVRSKMPAILKGLIFDMNGNALTPGYTRKTHKVYRYYINTSAIKHGYDSCEIKSLPAEDIENFLIAKVRELVSMPEIIHKVHQEARKQDGLVTLDYIRDALGDFNGVWQHLFPLEKARIMQLIVSRIVVSPQGMHITFHPGGLLNLCEQITPRQKKEKAA